MQAQTTWIEDMDEVSKGSSNFLRFDPDEDEKVLRIVKDPVKGISKFPYPDGSPKPEFKIEVLDGDSSDIKIWAVTNRSVMQQLVAIAKKEKITTMAGCIFRVTATGTGKNRTWFIKLLEKPARDPAGRAWLEDQKAGAR